MWALAALNLIRSPLRMFFSAVALVVAFLLLIMLQSIAGRFSAGAAFDDTRLIVIPKHRSGYQLPLSNLERIRQFDDVVAVSPLLPLYAYVQDPTNGIPVSAVDAAHIVRQFKEDSDLDPAVRSRFVRMRTAALVTPALARVNGWKVGDTVPIRSRVYRRENGWPVEVVGILPDDDSPMIWIHFDYVSEFYQGSLEKVPLIELQVKDAAHAAEVARRIDDMFAITPEPTITVSADYASRSWARQLGDVGRILQLILGVVFFSVLIVAASSAIQGARERASEHAVMAVFGFSQWRVAGLLAFENLLLCLSCAALGVVAAYALDGVLNRGLSGYVGSFHPALRDSLTAMLVAVGIALLITILQVAEIRRLDIAVALRGD